MTMEASPDLTKFAAAMATVQADIGGAIKGSVNPAFKSKYADLGSVFDTWQEIGPKNGFSVMQFPGLYDAEAKTMGMGQIVMHSSGQWIRSEMSVPLSKVDAQGYGSACTYARRYALAAAAGICPEEDDGNAASKPAQRAQQGAGISAAQCAELRSMIAKSGASEDAFCDYLKVGTLPELAMDNFGRAKAALEKRVQAHEAKEA